MLKGLPLRHGVGVWGLALLVGAQGSLESTGMTQSSDFNEQT